MTIKEAIKIIDPKTSREATRGMSLEERSQALDEAESIAVAALRAQLERGNQEPLTWDELLSMEGEPVWITDLRTNLSYCAIVGCECITPNGNKGVCWYSRKNDCGAAAVYGQKWLAYRYWPEVEGGAT